MTDVADSQPLQACWQSYVLANERGKTRVHSQAAGFCWNVDQGYEVFVNI